MPVITPCLWFENNTLEEAAAFYVSVFPNSPNWRPRFTPGDVGTHTGFASGRRIRSVDGHVRWTGRNASTRGRTWPVPPDQERTWVTVLLPPTGG